MTLSPPVLRAAERLLSDLAGSPVRLVRSEPLTAELSVVRCEVRGPADLPRTVIVRTHRTTGGWRTNPSYLFNDYAATKLLGSLDSSLCARLYGADLEAGVQVTEDLGTGSSLDDLLAGSDPTAASDGLTAWAAGLGDLHAATVGRSAEYGRLRQPLGPVDQDTHRMSLDERLVDADWDLVVGIAGDYGLRRMSSGVRADVEWVLGTLRDPGPFLALSNGDPCPYNSNLTGQSVRFFDFELAAFRHSLLDAACLRIPFPACYRWGRLPHDVRRASEAAYRGAFSSGAAITVDDETYLHGMAAATAAWAVARSARLPDPHRQLTSRDEVVVARVHAVVAAFVEAARTADVVPDLTEWFDALATAVRRTWGAAVTEPPLFPAFV